MLSAPEMVSGVRADCYSMEILAMAKNSLEVLVGQKGSECPFRFAGRALARGG